MVTTRTGDELTTPAESGALLSDDRWGAGACLPERDAELLLAIAGGDPEALGRLYDRYGHAAFALAMRTVDTRSAAEEIVCAAFRSVWRRAGSYDGRRGSVRVWILSLVITAAVDERRASINGDRGPS